MRTRRLAPAPLLRRFSMGVLATALVVSSMGPSAATEPQRVAKPRAQRSIESRRAPAPKLRRQVAPRDASRQKVTGSSPRYRRPLEGASPQSNNYFNSILANQPLIYFRLDESGGSVANDSSGNNQTGSYGPGTLFNVPGALLSDSDAAISSGSVTQSGTILPTGGADRTFEFWVQNGNLRDWSVTSGDQSTHPFNLVFSYTSWGSTCIDLQADTNAVLCGPISLADGKWHLIDVTFKAGTVAGYVDGQVISTASLTVNTAAGFPLVMSLGTSSGSPGLDEAAFYGTALSAANIDVHWTFGGSSSGVKCTTPSTALLGDPDGAVTGGTITQGGTTLPTGGADRTFELWVHNGDLRDWSVTSGDQAAHPFNVLFSPGTWGTYCFDVHADTDALLCGSIDLNTRTWHLIDVTFKAGAVTGYVDGQVIGTASLTVNTAGGSPLVINTGTSNGSPSFDEAAFYGTALSAAKIDVHWTFGGSSSGVKCTTPSTSSTYAQGVLADRPVLYFRLGDLVTDPTDR